MLGETGDSEIDKRGEVSDDIGGGPRDMSGGGFKAKIRGIYATALTKLLSDHGFQIVQPSVEIGERFGIETSEETPDLTIRDRSDRQGVEVTGNTGARDAFGSVLTDEFLDVVLRRNTDRAILDVEFPWDSKARLDEHRRALTPTVKMHHFYKACGGFISSSVDMAENLVLRGRPIEEVETLFRRTVEPYLPFEGSELGIEHVKLLGPALSLGKAVIDEYDEAQIKYSREIRSGGTYDGLGVEREAGDRAITQTRLGEYYIITRYYSCNGKFKGAYVNLNTPLELYPSKIRYVDLETDICIWPNGEAKPVDQEMLEAMASQGVITDRLYGIIAEKTKTLLSSVKGFL